MLPFQGEREEMVWLVGFRGQSPIFGQKWPKRPRNRGVRMGFWGGSKKGVFWVYPQNHRLANRSDAVFGGSKLIETEYRFRRKKV